MAHMTARIPKAAREWLRQIGSLGGKRKSQAKAAAARKNAQKPRPSRRRAS